MFASIAGDVELENDGLVHGAVDGFGGGHGVAEDGVPLGEHDFAGDHHAAPLAAFAAA